MASGYGSTVVGTAAGDLSAYVEEVTGGGLTQNIERPKTMADTNRVGTAEVIDIDPKPMTVVFIWNKTVYDTLHDQCVARTEDTWTFTNTEGSTWAGLGFVSDPGDADLAARVGKFTVTFTPKTYFAYTPAA